MLGGGVSALESEGVMTACFLVSPRPTEFLTPCCGLAPHKTVPPFEATGRQILDEAICVTSGGQGCGAKWLLPAGWLSICPEHTWPARWWAVPWTFCTPLNAEAEALLSEVREAC